MTRLGPDRRHLRDQEIPEFAGRTVLVLGDVMLDRYVTGQVRRISPEAPIPILKFEQSRLVLGGAGNVAANVAALGARAILVGVVGAGDAKVGDHNLGDANVGDLSLIVPAGIELRTVAIPNRPTTLKTRFMSGAHQLLRLDEEVSSPIAEADGDRVLAAYAGSLPAADVVILSDYAKGVLSDHVLERAIALARGAGKPIIADPKRADLAAYRHVTVLSPNEMEATQATGIAITDDASAVSAGQLALQVSEAGAILVTRSAKGLTLIRRDHAPVHLPAEARAVADVSGAGDTLVATLAVMLAAGAGLADAAMVANVAAGIAVGKLGTATISKAELATALRRQEAMGIDDKTLPLAAALDMIAGWRRDGLRVGFTNGCFDLIHPGHVILLQKARARCDRLIVALNTDASVQRLKGPARPVQNEHARATVMASIGAVDLVTLFEEDTPLEMIRTLRPDIIFKGADYRIDQVVGGEFVQSYGGEVGLIDLEVGHSTSGIIKRMAT